MKLLGDFISFNERLIERAQDPETCTHPFVQQGVKLKLAAPATDLDTGDSWLGGNPRLPNPFEWPQIEGKPLHFLGQIDCSALPVGIWGGLGPRRGYLAFFVGMAGSIRASVIHAPELGPMRHPPADWPDDLPLTCSLRPRFREYYARMPCWRLEVAPAGPDDEDRDRTLIDNNERFPQIDFTHEEFKPHDWSTLILLLQCAAESAEASVQQTRESLEATRKLVDDFLSSTTQQAELQERLRRLLPNYELRADALTAALSRAEAAAKTEPFNLSKWSDEMALAQADEGGAWAIPYEALRYRMAAFACGEDPSSLPAAVRTHFETRWAHDRDYEVAGMGGLPAGWSYDMLENVDDFAMLLELPTSYMVGWEWGGVNRLVIHLAAEDLRQGRFMNARAEISN